MIRWGKCGHPLHPVEGCRVCWTEEHTTEALHARATKTSPTSFTVKVTSVTPGENKIAGVVNGWAAKLGIDPPGAAVDVADLSNFTPGQAIDFVDYATERYKERERYRGREHEAHLYTFAMTFREACALFGLEGVAGVHAPNVEAMLLRVFASVIPDFALTSYFVVVRGSPVEQAHVDFVLDLRRRPSAGVFHIPDGFIVPAEMKFHPNEVDETIARICPPASRGEDNLDEDPVQYRFLGRPVTGSIYEAIIDANPVMLRYPSLGDLAKLASSAFEAAINQDSPLIGK